jgi:hypothetical protein
MRVVPILASTVLLSLISASCALHPVPSRHLDRSEATVRAAKAIGAAEDPEAAVHLRLAEQQLDAAKDRILDGDNEAAEWLLVRARADAELAQALALENWTRSDAAQAVEQVATVRRPRPQAVRAQVAASVPAR